MNASTKVETAYFNHIYSITIPSSVVDAVCQSGDNSHEVIDAMSLPEVKAELSEIKKDALIDELKEYGAWEVEELEDHSENLERILWIACWTIFEER